MIEWQYYPKSSQLPKHLNEIIDLFNENHPQFDSYSHELESDDVLQLLRMGLTNLEFVVEAGKKKEQKIHIPVLFGRNGKYEKSFDADAFNKTTKTVLEVEAGRAVDYNGFLKDLFQACLMTDVDQLVIALRLQYRENNNFERVLRFFDALYASGRLQLPLKGILIIGY
jgi:hypothetical protein